MWLVLKPGAFTLQFSQIDDQSINIHVFDTSMILPIWNAADWCLLQYKLSHNYNLFILKNNNNMFDFHLVPLSFQK